MPLPFRRFRLFVQPRAQKFAPVTGATPLFRRLAYIRIVERHHIIIYAEATVLLMIMIAMLIVMVEPSSALT
jgi:hypothetical protein